MIKLNNFGKKIQQLVKDKFPSAVNNTVNARIAIMTLFVDSFNTDPALPLFSRNIRNLVKYPGSHLRSLQKAGLLKEGPFNKNIYVIDFAESRPSKRIKKGIQIKNTRLERIKKLIAHIRKSEQIFIFVSKFLNIPDVLNLEKKLITLQDNEQHKLYNEIVCAIKQEGFVPEGYDELSWRCEPIPWFLSDFVINHLQPDS